MQQIILNNDLAVQIGKDNPIDLDFSAGVWDSAFQSPNLNLEETYLAEFKRINKDYDPVSYIYDFWKENGILKKFIAKIVDGDLTIVQGRIDMYDTDNYIDQFEGGYTTVLKLAITENRKSLEKQLQGIKIASFYEKEITKADLVEIVAVLNTVPDFGAAAIATISLVITTIQAIQAAQELIKNISKLSSTGGFLNAGVGAAIWIAIDIVSAAIVLAAYIVAIELLAKEIYDNLIGTQHYYNSVDVLQILTKLFAKLGYEFQSNIFETHLKELSIIASTDNKGDKTKGKASNNPIPDETGFDFYTIIAKMFNATLKVYDNDVVRMERKDFFFNEENTEVVLPQLHNNGIKKWNYSELYANISINYLRDVADGNSICGDFRRGLLIDFVTYTAKLERSKNVDIPFSRVTRKEGLNRVEEIYKKMIDPLQKLQVKFQNLEDRKGAILVNDFSFNNDYIFIRDSNKVSKTLEVQLNPESLYDEYHYIDAPMNSQFFIYEELSELPISLTDFKKLQNNNVAKDSNNNTIFIQSNIRDTKTGLHNITYRQRIPSNSVFYIPENTFFPIKSFPKK